VFGWLIWFAYSYLFLGPVSLPSLRHFLKHLAYTRTDLPPPIMPSCSRKSCTTNQQTTKEGGTEIAVIVARMASPAQRRAWAPGGAWWPRWSLVAHMTGPYEEDEQGAEREQEDGDGVRQRARVSRSLCGGVLGARCSNARAMGERARDDPRPGVVCANGQGQRRSALQPSSGAPAPTSPSCGEKRGSVVGVVALIVGTSIRSDILAVGGALGAGEAVPLPLRAVNVDQDSRRFEVDDGSATGSMAPRVASSDDSLTVDESWSAVYLGVYPR